MISSSQFIFLRAWQTSLAVVLSANDRLIVRTCDAGAKHVFGGGLPGAPNLFSPARALVIYYSVSRALQAYSHEWAVSVATMNEGFDYLIT